MIVAELISDFFEGLAVVVVLAMIGATMLAVFLGASKVVAKLFFAHDKYPSSALLSGMCVVTVTIILVVGCVAVGRAGVLDAFVELLEAME